MHSTYDLVWYAAERTPHHLAIVDDRTDRQLSYSELIAEIEAIAAGLAARGIKPGSRFATVLPNFFEHALFVLAQHRRCRTHVQRSRSHLGPPHPRHGRR